MRRVLALRHAKAVDRSQAATDADRALAERGRKQAALLGRLMAERGYVPDHVVCSSAARTRETAALVAESLGVSAAVEVVEALYTGRAAAYGGVLAGCPDHAGTVLLVGHNPATEELVAALVGKPVSLGTCCLAVMDLDIGIWKGMATRVRANLVELLRPEG